MPKKKNVGVLKKKKSAMPKNETSIELSDVSEIFESKDWDELEIRSTEYLRALRRLIPKEKIITFRFLPIWRGEKLLKLHLLFVTRYVLYYSYLSQGFFEFRDIPIENVSLRTQFYPSRNARAGRIELLFHVGDLRSDGSPHFHKVETPWSMYGQIVTLLSKINSLKLERYRYEPSSED